MDKLRVGVIGVGSISDFHIQPYIDNKDVELVAFCDIDEKRLKEKAEKYKVEKTFQDYNEMLKMDDLDAVSICTWNNSHAPIAIAVLRSGKNVLNEKPLCINVDEALEVEKAVEETGKILQVGFVRRSSSNTRTVKEFVDAGELGEIYYAKASCLRRIGNPGGWFADINKSGGGPLIDLGVHIIDLAWYLMGKPKVKSVSGNTYKRLGNLSNIKDRSTYKAADYCSEKNDVEDITNALIRFENGASLYIDTSYSLHIEKDQTRIEIFGEKGGAMVEPQCKIVTERYDRLVDIVPIIDNPTMNFEMSFKNEIDSFVDCCLNKGKILVQFLMGLPS